MEVGAIVKQSNPNTDGYWKIQVTLIDGEKIYGDLLDPRTLEPTGDEVRVYPERIIG